MWVWILSGLAAWSVLSVVAASVIARVLFVAETEEQLVEMQRAARDAECPPLVS